MVLTLPEPDKTYNKGFLKAVLKDKDNAEEVVSIC